MPRAPKTTVAVTISSGALLALSCALLLVSWPGMAAETAAERAEEQGIEAQHKAPATAAQRGRRKCADGPGKCTGGIDLLLIPDSTNDRVMAFDPVTGDLIDADFIPADPTNMSTPKCAMYKADCSGFLVSEQLDDVILEYDLYGSYVGVFAPFGGRNATVLDNPRGIRYHPDTGNLLITVGGGDNIDTVITVDNKGNYLGTFVAAAAGGLDSPFDIVFTADHAYVGGTSSDAIHRYDRTTGAYIDNLVALDGGFPQQLAWGTNGNLLIANSFGSQAGAVEVRPDGSVQGIYLPSPLSGPRGIYELPSGNLLVTTDTGVHEITRANTYVAEKIGGVSAHYITLAIGVVPVSLQSFSVE